MDRNTVALEITKGLVQQWNEYTNVELLMADAFRAADAFIEQARQNTAENSPASPVQHAQGEISQLIDKWCDIEKPSFGRCRALRRFAEWAEKQQASAQ